MRQVVLKQSVSHGSSTYHGLAIKMSMSQCTQCRKGQGLRPQTCFRQASGDVLNLCRDRHSQASMSCLTPPMCIICIHPSGCITQVLADNSDMPFEHLPAEEEVDDALLPVHPFQQRILDLKSTPPTALSRQAPSLFLMPWTPLEPNPYSHSMTPHHS